MRHRLYWHIYLTLVGSLGLMVLIAGGLWRHLADSTGPSRAFEVIAEVVYAALPPSDQPREAQQGTLQRFRNRIGADLALFAPDGAPLAAVGRPLPAPEPGREQSGWSRGFSTDPTWAIALPDGRWLMARVPHEHRSPAPRVIFTLGLIALAVAIGAYPVTRRLTRRLENLQASVEALGAGDLKARVKAEGHDEVSSLALSFNRAAERIEQLVSAHKALLANASHELRSPLARIRVAIEMQKAEARPGLRAELERDIAELDQLIDEILLASSLDARAETPRQEVDLLALLAEECARAGAALDGSSPVLHGDPRLLRRLVRNLLENARRHGAGSPVDVSVGEIAGNRVAIEVCDRGPGVAESERERIFEPFYRPSGTREREGGVGLGLALVRQIARRHGGEVHCLPRNGGGACFRVELNQ